MPQQSAAAGSENRSVRGLPGWRESHVPPRHHHFCCPHRHRQGANVQGPPHRRPRLRRLLELPYLDGAGERASASTGVGSAHGWPSRREPVASISTSVAAFVTAACTSTSRTTGPLSKTTASANGLATCSLASTASRLSLRSGATKTRPAAPRAGRRSRRAPLAKRACIEAPRRGWTRPS